MAEKGDKVLTKEKETGNPKYGAGNGEKGSRLIKQLVLALLNVMFLICLAITLTVLFRPLYYFDIEYLGIPESSGYSAQVCRENYDVLIDYNLLVSPDKLDFPDFPMSRQGEIHFEEVKRIFVGAQWIALIGFGAFVLRILWQRRRKDRDFRWLAMSSWVCLALVGLVGGGVLLSWEKAFVLMHQILFRNDYWIFNATTDPVIKILPDTFFMHCGILILLLLLLFLTACYFLKKKLERATEKKIGADETKS